MVEVVTAGTLDLGTAGKVSWTGHCEAGIDRADVQVVRLAAGLPRHPLTPGLPRPPTSGRLLRLPISGPLPRRPVGPKDPGQTPPRPLTNGPSRPGALPRRPLLRTGSNLAPLLPPLPVPLVATAATTPRPPSPSLPRPRPTRQGRVPGRVSTVVTVVDRRATGRPRTMSSIPTTGCTTCQTCRRWPNLTDSSSPFGCLIEAPSTMRKCGSGWTLGIVSR